jgi:hypothetical protein
MGGSTNVTSTTQQSGSSQTDLPAWAKPYFERNLAKAEAEYSKPYEAYTGDRYAATGTDTLKARDMTRDISKTRYCWPYRRTELCHLRNR